MSHFDDPTTATEAPERLQRIQEVAAALGLTTRTIRYYEEIGLLRPAARSGGDYRLYDEDDVERLRFIKDLRDEAGFSLAEISRMLEDEAARTRNRDRFRASTDEIERRAIIADALDRVDRQISSLQSKAERLATMIEDAKVRRDHLVEHQVQLATGKAPAHHRDDEPSNSSGADSPRRR